MKLAQNQKLKDIVDKLDDLITDETIDKLIAFLKDLKDNK